MVSKKWFVHTVVIGSTQINQIQALYVNPGVQKLFDYGSGQVDPGFAGFDGERPVLRFRTTALKRALGTINVLNGQAISSGTHAKIYFQQGAEGGTRQTGSTGLLVDCAEGVACITRISCPRDGAIAILEGMIYASSADGETSPLAYTQNAALPTLLANDQAYTVGPLILNGTEVGGIESFDFDPKINVVLNRSDGQPFPTYAYIKRRGDEQDGPSVIMSTRHLEKIAAGSTQAITGLTFASLRSMKAGAFREAPSAAKHIRFTANAGALVIPEGGAEDGDEGAATLDLAATNTSTLPAFSVSTDQDLTTLA